MGLSAELVVTTLVGLGLGWLVGGIGARPVFVVVGALLGGAAGVNQVYRTWRKRHGVAVLPGDPAVFSDPLRSFWQRFRQVSGFSSAVRYAACNPSGAAPNGRQGTW